MPGLPGLYQMEKEPQKNERVWEVRRMNTIANKTLDQSGPSTAYRGHPGKDCIF